MTRSAKPARRRVDPDLLAQLNGMSLVTAEITYRMPDCRRLLQTFLWQEYDAAPRFPRLERFLDFWDREIEGPIHSVRMTHERLMRPVEIRAARDWMVH